MKNDQILIVFCYLLKETLFLVVFSMTNGENFMNRG